MLSIPCGEYVDPTKPTRTMLYQTTQHLQHSVVLNYTTYQVIRTILDMNIFNLGEYTENDVMTFSHPCVKYRQTFPQAFPDNVRDLGAHRKPSSTFLPLDPVGICTGTY